MFRRRGKFTKRRTFRRKRFSRGSFRKSVRKVIYKMAEKKYITLNYSTALNNSGFLSAITDQIPTGNDAFSRIGNKINVRYIMPRLSLQSDNENLIYVRVAILRARTKGLGLGDLPTGANAMVGFIDIERWEIISDRTYNLGMSDENGRNKKMAITKHRIMKQVTYDNAAINTGVENSLYLFAWSSDVIVVNPTFTGNLRCYFTDV